MNRKPYMNCLPVRHQGKVRDSFDGTTTPGTFLIIATDAVSTRNVAHKSLVPDKGYLLNALSIFWILEVLKRTPHHIVAFGKKIYEHLPKNRPYPDDLHMRAIVVKILKMVPVEFIERKRLCGSLYDKFYSKGLSNPYGIKLEPGLSLMHPFDQPIFTPTEKTATDDELNSNTVEYLLPEEVSMTHDVYRQGFEYAIKRGIEIIDTKEEVGRDKDGVLCLGDEWLTCDSSRFVDQNAISLGEMPPWQDKEIVRQDAMRQWANGPKVPLEFSEKILSDTSNAYHRIFEQLTGENMRSFFINL